MTASACTVHEFRLGFVDQGECGQPVVRSVTHRCEHGHTETTQVCAEHEWMGDPNPQEQMPRLYCADCADGGNLRVRTRLVETVAAP